MHAFVQNVRFPARLMLQTLLFKDYSTMTSVTTKPLSWDERMDK